MVSFGVCFVRHDATLHNKKYYICLRKSFRLGEF